MIPRNKFLTIKLDFQDSVFNKLLEQSKLRTMTTSARMVL